MTAIDDFVEKYESKIDKIKYRPVRDAIRGFISGMGLPGIIIEGVVLHKGGLEEKLPSELCTLGWKDWISWEKQYPHASRKPAITYTANAIGCIAACYLSIETAFIPWIATGAVDLVNLYLKKKEKRNKQKNIESVDSIVGFGAVERLGRTLSRYEIKLIANYAGRDKKERTYIKNVLRTNGRPFELYKSGFKCKCKKCGALRNYCCC